MRKRSGKGFEKINAPVTAFLPVSFNGKSGTAHQKNNTQKAHRWLREQKLNYESRCISGII